MAFDHMAHEDTNRVDSLEYFGSKDENPTQYAALQAVLEYFKATVPDDRVYAYNADSDEVVFHTLLEPFGLADDIWPDELDLEHDGFERVLWSRDEDGDVVNVGFTHPSDPTLVVIVVADERPDLMAPAIIFCRV